MEPKSDAPEEMGAAMPPKHFNRRLISDLLEDGFADAPNTTMLDAAVAYAKKRLCVFPLYPVNEDGSCACSDPQRCAAGKHPLARLVPHGHKEATTDVATIIQWWAEWPDAGIGIALEPSGLVIVGPDSPHWLGQFKCLGLPATAYAESGSGPGHRHYYYRRPIGCALHRICEAGEYDILSSGYIVAPPTLHKSGRRYVWGTPIMDAETLPEAPDWVVEKLCERGKRNSAIARHTQGKEGSKRVGPDGKGQNERTEFGDRLRDLMCQENVLPAVLPQLGIPSQASNVGLPFYCPLGCADGRSKSATLCRGNNDLLHVRTFHGCQGPKEVWLLAEVYAGVRTGQFRTLTKPELSCWSLRLLRDAGCLTPVTLPPLSLPTNASKRAWEVAEAFQEVLALARGIGIEAIPFARKFAAAWTGLEPDEVRTAWDYLKKHSVVRCVQPFIDRRSPGLWTLP